MKLNPRKFGLACAAAAVGFGLVLAGCANTVEGTATPNQVQATSYKAEAASSSAAATSSKAAAAKAKAISDNCTPFRKTTGTAVDRYNDFVDAHDANAADQSTKRDTAANALEDAARTVETGVNASGSDLPADISQKLTDYVTAARALAAEVRKTTATSLVGPLNDASRKVNDALNAARSACPA
ncbi:hypothetical protein LTV02_18045 [Nocardia yamanashiensis]|uniref:hypothetical protein n=1 Tax=Nocardia yamanashiensis TaxID=209247 RepID=UPI0008313A47|nr:hypothetical protein [Nocardia yamanashiensis]UGT45172.1 hypothetical protein LTV02_18045 [Nocardia yamanashiensis]